MIDRALTSDPRGAAPIAGEGEPSRPAELLHRLSASRIAAALAAMLGFGLAARSLALAVARSTPVPYMDQWEFVADLMRFRAGDYGWADLFAQQNEHRIFTARLVFFLDAFADHLQNLLVVLTSYLLLGGLAALLGALAAWRRSRRAGLVAFALALAALWSVAGWINLGWAFQVQWAFVHLLPAAAIALFAASARRSGGRAAWLLAGACLADALGVVSMASGLVTVAPVVAVAVWMRARPSRLALFVVVHGALAGLYLWGYEAPEQRLVFDPGAVLRYLAPYLGTAVPGSVRTSTAVGAVGLTLGFAAMTAATVMAVARRRPLSAPSAALLGIAGFVLAEGLVTAMGRAGLPDPTALALRYATPALVFWTAMALAAWRWSCGLSSPWLGRGIVLAATAAVAASNLAGGTSQAWHDWSAAADNAGFMMIDGATTNAWMDKMYPDPAAIQDRIAFLRENRLGPFADGAARFRAPLDSLGEVRTADLAGCTGAMDLDAVDAAGEVHVQGWAVTGRDGRSAEWAIALAEDGHVLGYARTWQRRFDDPPSPGRAPATGFDFWFPRPPQGQPPGVAIVAVFPGGTAPPCLMPKVGQAIEPAARPRGR